jgi:hypothetical protein
MWSEERGRCGLARPRVLDQALGLTAMGNSPGGRRVRLADRWWCKAGFVILEVARFTGRAALLGSVVEPDGGVIHGDVPNVRKISIKLSSYPVIFLSRCLV